MIHCDACQPVEMSRENVGGKKKLNASEHLTPQILQWCWPKAKSAGWRVEWADHSAKG